MWFIVIYLVACIIVALLCDDTTLGFGSGLILSIFFTPVGGFIIYLFYPSKDKRDQQIELLKTIADNKAQPDNLQIMHDKLEKLEEMKKKNLVTEKEYNFLRAEIIAVK